MFYEPSEEPLPTQALACLRTAGNHDHTHAEHLRTAAHKERQRGREKRRLHLTALTLRTEAGAADLQREAR